jgi:GUN4-like
MKLFEKYKAYIFTGGGIVATATITAIITPLIQPVVSEWIRLVKSDDKISVINCTSELSEKGFPELKSLCSPLKNNAFKEADDQTFKAIGSMIHEENWDKNRTYHGEDIVNKRICPQLIEIDKLWRSASSNRLGFTIQKKIWNETKNNYPVFAKKVGWTQNGDWKRNLSYELNSSMPDGHLPVLWNQKPGQDVSGNKSFEKEYTAFFKAIEVCDTK